MVVNDLCHLKVLVNLEKMQRIIYFDEKQHKYTDDLGNAYTSVTTVIDKYAVHFDTMKVSRACERIGRNPTHKIYL